MSKAIRIAIIALCVLIVLMAVASVMLLIYMISNWSTLAREFSDTPVRDRLILSFITGTVSGVLLTLTLHSVSVRTSAPIVIAHSIVEAHGDMPAVYGLVVHYKNGTDGYFTSTLTDIRETFPIGSKYVP